MKVPSTRHAITRSRSVLLSRFIFRSLVQMSKYPCRQFRGLRGPHIRIFASHRHPQLDLTSCGDTIFRRLAAFWRPFAVPSAAGQMAPDCG